MPHKRSYTPGQAWDLAPVLSFSYAIFRSWVLRVDKDRALRLGRGYAALFLGAVKKRCVLNMQRFFGTIDPQRDKKLYSAYVSLVGQTLIENILDGETSRETLLARSELAGQEHIDEALKLGKGVMLLGSHLGNFYAYHQVLSLHGYPLTNVSQKIPARSMEAQANLLRQKFGVTSVFVDGNAARSVIKTFRENRILSVIFEVAVRLDKAVTLPFGAALLASDPGPAQLAVRFGVPVLPVNIDSSRAFSPRVEVLPPFPAPQGETEDERALNLLKMWRIWLQDEVAKRPEQWWPWSLTDLEVSST